MIYYDPQAPCSRLHQVEILSLHLHYVIIRRYASKLCQGLVKLDLNPRSQFHPYIYSTHNLPEALLETKLVIDRLHYNGFPDSLSPLCY